MRAKEVLRQRARGGGGGSVGTVCTLATVNNKQPGRVRECYENYVLIHDLESVAVDACVELCSSRCICV